MFYSAIFNENGSLQATRNHDREYKLVANEYEITEAQFNMAKYLKLVDGVVEISLDKLAEYQTKKISEISNLSFSLREDLIPDYRLTNATLGVYDAQTLANCLETVEAFRSAFYAGKSAIEAAESFEAVDSAVANIEWPTTIIEP